MPEHTQDMIELVRNTWGEPNIRLSNRKEVRFGSKGGRKISLEEDIWYDFEANVGGGYRDLYKLIHGSWPPNGYATYGSGIPLDQNEIMETHYYYQDEYGAFVGRATRIDKANAPKRFLQYRWEAGGWAIGLNGAKLPLYNLPAILEAPRGSIVYIVEGERCADALNAWGLLATTNSGGAKKFRRAHAESLKHFRCIVLPDNDTAGHEHVVIVQAELAAAGCRQVQVLTLPGLPEAGDVVDWIASGGNREGFTALVEALGPSTADPSKQSHPLLTAAEFMATFTNPDYLIDGVIQRGRLHALTSMTGHGKTALGLLLACSIAMGRPVGNLEVVQGHVLILAGENPDDLCGRFWAACQHYGIDPDKLPISVIPGNYPLDDDTADTLVQKIGTAGLKPAFILADSLAAFFPGEDDNQNVQMGAYARSLRKLTMMEGNPAVVVLCHPIKAAAKDNLLPRGGGAFLNEIDANLTLWSEAQGEVTTLHWQGKIRGADFSPINFSLQPVRLDSKQDAKGRPFVSVVAALQTSEQAEDAIKREVSAEDAVLEWLRRQPGISVRTIALNLGYVSDSGSPHIGKVQRLLKRLDGMKLVRHWRGKWKITDAGEDELKRVRKP